jgi:hypothetical protein
VTATGPAAPSPLSADALHAVFLALLPRIARHGRVYFRHVKCPHRMEDALAEMTALAWRWYVRLAQRGKDAARFPSALAAFAARAVKSGRRLCGQEKAKDALSPRARARRGFRVERLPDYGTPSGNPLDDALTDNTVTPVDEQVAFRLDFPAWLATLGGRDRRVALDLMAGERTRDVARKYGRSPGRVAQLRRRFHDDWRRFHAEDP